MAATLLMGVAAFAQTPNIQFDSGAFRVNGWHAPAAPPAKGWQSVFTVYAGAGNVPPLLGSYAVESGALVFHPRYPVAAGVHYRAVFHPPGGVAMEKTFDGPAKETARVARVTGVYPSADVLPSNDLRLYITFSVPMSRGEAARRIHLLDDSGKEQNAMLLPGQELWDPNFQRLTMTFDPGRIKRGLTSNEAIGPPITEGKRYRLVIDGDWPDARGVPMLNGFTKVFRGGPPDRTPPDPKLWRVTAPKAGTREPVTIDFPDAMNYALLQRMIHVGNVKGDISLARNETEWRFTPQDPWKAGDYKLVIDTNIEDLAGNHIGGLFDIDVFEKVTEHITQSTVTLPFSVK